MTARYRIINNPKRVYLSPKRREVLDGFTLLKRLLKQLKGKTQWLKVREVPLTKKVSYEPESMFIVEFELK